MRGYFFHFLLLLLAGLLFTTPLQAEDDFSAETLQSYNDQLDAAEQELKQAGENIARLDKLAAVGLGLEQKAQGCMAQFEQKQAQLQEAIASLGEVQPDEDADLTRKRNELDANKKNTDKILSQCRLLDLRASTLLDEARQTRQESLQQQLFAHSASILEHVTGLLREPGNWDSELGAILGKFITMPLDWRRLGMALIYGMAGMLAGLVWSLYKRRQYRRQKTLLYDTSPTLEAVWRSLLRVAPYSLFAGLSALFIYFYPVGAPALLQLALFLLVFSLSYATLYSLLRTAGRVEGIVPADSHKNNRLYFWARLLLFTTMVGVVLHAQWFDMPEQGRHLIGLLRMMLGALVGLALARLIWLMAEHILFLRHTRLYLIIAGLMLIAVSSLWLGYRNFSTFLFTGVFGSLFVLLLTWLLIKIPVEIFDGMDAGRTPWEERLRTHLGLKSGQIMPGLIWLRLAHLLVVFGLAAIALLRLWGMSEQNLTLLLGNLTEGFAIAGFRLEPLRIIGGLLLVAAAVSLTHVFKRHLAEAWLRRTTLSRGAREATTTISGYVGVLLAILLGLSVAGIELSSLAIIAGALSVGIGFGLQNIVNNFVSGLILLFERPIRRGDWVRVGDIQGHVKEISIRSTTIQTFDREDVIIPNSEFVSGKVTNMELNNTYGRVIVSVGVAYGSDTELVLKLLKEIGEQHPESLRENGEVKVMALFRSFGESALNFELYCQIRNVGKKLQVISDLNMSIDKAFRKHGIEIPFPQRSVHLLPPEAEPADKQHQEAPAQAGDLG